MVVAEGRNILHHVKREEELSGKGTVGGVCPGEYVGAKYRFQRYETRKIVHIHYSTIKQFSHGTFTDVFFIIIII